MINDFDALKKQLAELADVINAFKSEAVQLRIVDLVLGGGKLAHQPHSSITTPEQHSERSPQTKQRRKGKNTNTSAGKPQRKRHGPAAVLDELIQDTFFSQPKTISEIIDHAAARKARSMKPNELSGPLGRFTRDKKLSRKKNADGQYEYTAK